jgi:hypothetical protein
MTQCDIVRPLRQCRGLIPLQVRLRCGIVVRGVVRRRAIDGDSQRLRVPKNFGRIPPKSNRCPCFERSILEKSQDNTTTQHTLKRQEKGPRYGRGTAIGKLRPDDCTTIPLEQSGGPPLPSSVRRVQLGIVNHQQKLRGGHGGE